MCSMKPAASPETWCPCVLVCCTMQMATQIVGSLMALEAMDEEEDIRIYINSSGAHPFPLFSTPCMTMRHSAGAVA